MEPEGSSGAGLAFTRDAEGRITEVTWPSGQRLLRPQADRIGHVFITTTTEEALLEWAETRAEAIGTPVGSPLTELVRATIVGQVAIP
jgi:hypothetical protein